jgi:putative addiction module killer protein
MFKFKSILRAIYGVAVGSLLCCMQSNTKSLKTMCHVLSNKQAAHAAREAIKKLYTLYITTEYKRWFNDQPKKSQAQIADRLKNIEFDGYFGNHKSLEGAICELKWVNGRRLYYTYLAGPDLLLLLGGNKSDQSKDIAHAKKILQKYTSSNS